jgi:hypothetical protein
MRDWKERRNLHQVVEGVEEAELQPLRLVIYLAASRRTGSLHVSRFDFRLHVAEGIGTNRGTGSRLQTITVSH